MISPFITGHGDIDTAVRLLRQGAPDRLTKAFDLDVPIMGESTIG